MSTEVFAAPVSPKAARAHAQKNCLSVIAAIANLVSPDLPEASRRRMGRLQDAVKRLAALVDDDFEREPEPALGRTTLGIVDVCALVRRVCDLVADRAEARSVVLVVDCCGGSLAGDEDGLAEALFNVLANAIDATPAGRAVYLDTASTPDGDQHWTIQDTGQGMSNEALEQLGTPYRTTRVDGTGLGVALAIRIVQAHHGQMRFESTLGEGTRVTIWIPRGVRRQRRIAATR